MKRVLLTGAGGFVGHHFLEHALENTDWEIICLDSFRHRGKTSRIREVLDAHDRTPQGRSSFTWRDRVTVLTHDLRAPIDAQLAERIGEIDYLVSIASESHVDRSITEPRSFIENNVQLVLTLLDYVREHPVEKFLHVSTDEVYGPASVGHNHVEGEPHRPSNPYSASKAAQEDIIYSYWRTYGLPVGISNTMNIIGERQDPEKFVPLVLSKVLAGQTVPIHASVDEYARPVSIGSRYYLHARNQADALLFLLRTQPFPIYADSTEMGRWNVVGEREVDNLKMAGMIATYANRKIDYELVNWHESRPGHDLRYALDGSRMAALGWKPPIPLAESLRRTVCWTLENRRWLM
jgi:dTDP-glucose 4,6-dehydratase